MLRSVNELETELAARVRPAPAGARCCARHPAWARSSRPGYWPRSVTTPAVRHRQRAARVRRHRPGHPSLRTFTLDQGPQGPQQTPRRRLPLVGLRRPDQIRRCPSPLRPSPRRRRRPQRRAAQPRQQAPRPAVVVPSKRPDMGRHSRWPHRLKPDRRCLTTDRRGMSMCRPGRGSPMSRSSSTPTRAGFWAGGSRRRCDRDGARWDRTGHLDPPT